MSRTAVEAPIELAEAAVWPVDPRTAFELRRRGVPLLTERARGAVGGWSHRVEPWVGACYALTSPEKIEPAIFAHVIAVLYRDPVLRAAAGAVSQVELTPQVAVTEFFLAIYYGAFE